MILRHFQLREQPFGGTPDPRFLFATETHREALAALLYGIESGLGFIVLTARPGMGKTTLAFEALSRLKVSARTVFLFQAIASPLELVRALLIDLGQKDPRGTMVDLETRLNEILVGHSESGKRLVVVIDEAQNLDLSVLEAVRMLSNFETASRKLLQIVLCGQLELAERLCQPSLLQLRQRISIFATLKPLSLFETADYIEHRLKVAGYKSQKPLFTSQAVTLIAHESRGIPRNINNLCFNSLSLACAFKRPAVDADVVREAIADLDLGQTMRAAAAALQQVEGGRVKTRPLARLPLNWPGLRVAAIAMALSAIVSAAGWTYLIDTNTFAGRRTAHPPLQPPQPAKDEDAVAARAAVSASSPSSKPVSHTEQLRPAIATVAFATATRGENPVEQPPAPDPAESSAAAATVEDELRLVEARGGQSMAGLCAEQFSDCTPALLRQIIDLNPRIPDPDHLQQGQRVVLPAGDAVPRSTRSPPSVE